MNRLQKLTAFDTRIFFWCTDLHRALRLTPISRFISRLGDGLCYLLIGSGLALWDQDRGLVFFQVGLIAFSLELPLYLLLKNTIRRDRPCHCLQGFRAVIEPSDKFSFPSGHAAAAFVFATVLVAHYPFLFLPAYLVAMLIGLARVLLGVHYPTDIAAGALLGICSASLAMHLWEVF
ncbi:MAG: phosphatase PAP2 family protein [Oceanospirillaceae bacterium]|nr:phosphatase PAP2 family protein [Oceanospirillaceae bacterium]